MAHYLVEIKRSLEANGWVYDSTVDDNVRKRAEGATFSMSDHIRAMVLRCFQIERLGKG